MEASLLVGGGVEVADPDALAEDMDLAGGADEVVALGNAAQGFGVLEGAVFERAQLNLDGSGDGVAVKDGVHQARIRVRVKIDEADVETRRIHVAVGHPNTIGVTGLSGEADDTIHQMAPIVGTRELEIDKGVKHLRHAGDAGIDVGGHVKAVEGIERAVGKGGIDGIAGGDPIGDAVDVVFAEDEDFRGSCSPARRRGW